MTDYTHQILLGLEAKSKMKLARSTAKTVARSEFETQIKARERDLFSEAESEFAQTIKRLHDSGVPGSVIRREILGTNDWGTWKRWRDLAGVEPEAQMLERLKREELEEAKPYRVEGDHFVLTKDRDGKTISEIPFYTFESYGRTAVDATDPSYYPQINGHFGSLFEGLSFMEEALKKYGDFEEENND